MCLLLPQVERILNDEKRCKVSQFRDKKVLHVAGACHLCTEGAPAVRAWLKRYKCGMDHICKDNFLCNTFRLQETKINVLFVTHTCQYH